MEAKSYPVMINLVKIFRTISNEIHHCIGYGLNNIHEGSTICHPVNLHPDFKIFAFNSENKPLVLFAEENENHGRVLLDFGFTKLFP